MEVSHALNIKGVERFDFFQYWLNVAFISEKK